MWFSRLLSLLLRTKHTYPFFYIYTQILVTSLKGLNFIALRSTTSSYKGFYKPNSFWPNNGFHCTPISVFFIFFVFIWEFLWEDQGILQLCGLCDSWEHFLCDLHLLLCIRFVFLSHLPFDGSFSAFCLCYWVLFVHCCLWWKFLSFFVNALHGCCLLICLCLFDVGTAINWIWLLNHWYLQPRSNCFLLLTEERNSISCIGICRFC